MVLGVISSENLLLLFSIDIVYREFVLFAWHIQFLEFCLVVFELMFVDDDDND